MRALRYHGPMDLRLDDLPEPKCGPTQVKIRPAFVGICGTDLHEYHTQTFVPKHALVEPLAVAWHAIILSGIKAGESSLVVGTGPIGLAVIQCLKAMDAGDIIAVEVAAKRQEFAKQFGATHVLDPTQVDVVKEARKLTCGRGPSVAFDCAGVPSSLESSTRAVCAHGTVVNVAIVSL
ncbi:hypothetical protein ONZ43_g5188 [Nemania bipapillata]|uniref:Uncharacterized protein n=1 Tax=Nemania bipapillata TaxID=110536 RepID=A0ACC2IDN9_9PEZI|nr:hypothetical protein ONZ43_g5188 [Nemania bipapillata]